MKPLLPAVKLYAGFAKYILGDVASDPFPLLQYVIENGNTTVYEWRYGEPPLAIESDPIHIEIDDADQASGDQVNIPSILRAPWSF